MTKTLDSNAKTVGAGGHIKHNRRHLPRGPELNKHRNLQNLQHRFKRPDQDFGITHDRLNVFRNAHSTVLLQQLEGFCYYANFAVFL